MDITRGETNSKSNPRVMFAWQFPNVGETSDGVNTKGGFFIPITSFSFRVEDPEGNEIVAATVVDVDDPANILDSEDAGRIVVPTFTIGALNPVGEYTLEVTFEATPVGGSPIPARTLRVPFRVLDEGLGGVLDAYAQVADLIANGFPIGDPAPCAGFTTADARRALLRASRYVEEITGRTFSPAYRALDLDGRGGSILQLHVPIVGLTAVTFTFTTFTPADLPISEGDLRVYNRHIRQNLLEPDDRQDPRIEFLRTPSYRYPRGEILGDVDLLSGDVGFAESQQNVKVKGVFGYTDPDGSPFGKTPDLIVEATMRLAARYIQPLWKQLGGAGAVARPAGAIQSEKTMDQSVTYANAAFGGAAGNAFAGVFTGDPEIDQILALFMRPPRFGSA